MQHLSPTHEQWREVFEASFLATARRLYPESEQLHQACRYALEGGGKRIRPLLTMASCYAVCGSAQPALASAMAVEWVHTYSLVHDDLPVMDNDDWRRGRPATHKEFDEATALLVGDALLADAFYILSSDPNCKTDALRALARAAGGQGMVRGQALDIYWTNRKTYTRPDLDLIHQHKTGDLIAASCLMGAYAGRAESGPLESLEAFGARLGLAFQIVDDLLDSSSATGKSAGKDQSSGKLTYLRLMNESEARGEAERLTQATLASLEHWDERADPLRQLARLLLQRTK